ncbi:hypothetical protein LXL04_014825 [Taraxacum kok-saghyz]
MLPVGDCLHRFGTGVLLYNQRNRSQHPSKSCILQFPSPLPIRLDFNCLPLRNRKTVVTSDHALKLEFVPDLIAIVGSGYIGLEFMCTQHLVTFSEALDQLMPGFDPEIRKLAQRVLINPRKIDYHTGVFATKNGKPIIIELTDAKTKERKETLENMAFRAISDDEMRAFMSFLHTKDERFIASPRLKGQEVFGSKFVPNTRPRSTSHKPDHEITSHSMAMKIYLKIIRFSLNSHLMDQKRHRGMEKSSQQNLKNTNFPKMTIDPRKGVLKRNLSSNHDVVHPKNHKGPINLRLQDEDEEDYEEHEDYDEEEHEVDSVREENIGSTSHGMLDLK